MDTHGFYTQGQQVPPVPVGAEQMCAQWVRRAYGDSASDHLGILMDLGPRSLACQPSQAVVLQATGANTLATVRHSLPSPGSVMWYRVNDPGAYSVGFLANSDAARDLRIDVFAENDLGKKLTPIDEIDRGAGSGCTGVSAEICAFTTTTYFPPNRPFYLRVYDPQGLRTGTFDLLVKRHDCATERFACPLNAAEKATEVAPPASLPYTGHFIFTTDTPKNGKAQSLEIPIANPNGVPLRVRVRRNQVWDKPIDIVANYTLRRKEAERATYLVTVQRGAVNARFSVRWTTDAYYVVGSIAGLPVLSCSYESTEALGDDEIRFRVFNDGAQLQENFFPDVDKSDPLFVPIGGPFVGNLGVEVAELAGDTVGSPVDAGLPNSPNGPLEIVSKTISPLARNTVETRNNELVFQFFPGFPANGEYRLRYDLVHSLR
jgi:hypothetical protein